MKRVLFTDEECKALYEIIQGGGTPEMVWREDGEDDFSDPKTRAAAKLYAVVGADIPAHLVPYIADVGTLNLPHGTISVLQTAHAGARGVCLPRQIVTVGDLCEYSAGELTERGVIWGRAVEDIRRALGQVGLKLKGDE